MSDELDELKEVVSENTRILSDGYAERVRQAEAEAQKWHKKSLHQSHELRNQEKRRTAIVNNLLDTNFKYQLRFKRQHLALNTLVETARLDREKLVNSSAYQDGIALGRQQGIEEALRAFGEAATLGLKKGDL